MIISKGQPVAQIKPVPKGADMLRPFGLCAGEFTVPDDFDAPMSEALLKSFEGE